MRLDPERFLVNVAGYTQATSPKARPPRLATIDYGYDPGTFPGVWPRVVFDGETTPTRKRWPVLSGYWPRPGDRVLMQPVGLSSYVIVGTLSQEGASYVGGDRSEERRVGKECRSRWSPGQEKKNGRTSVGR